MEPGVTERQRGRGVFPRLIEVLHRLNDRGHGQGDSGLVLNLVHNPGGAYLPASQAVLEAHYRRTLLERYGICFDHLFCITNMPVGRYLEYLRRTDNYEEYMRGLVMAFNPATLGGVMCKRMLSVGWDGSLYDCDFNQMLGLRPDHDAPGYIQPLTSRSWPAAGSRPATIVTAVPQAREVPAGVRWLRQPSALGPPVALADSHLF